MRTGITLGFPHGGGSPKMVAHPGVELEKQKAGIKALKVKGVSPDFERIEFWLSDSGLHSRVKLAKPPPVEKPKA